MISGERFLKPSLPSVEVIPEPPPLPECAERGIGPVLYVATNFNAWVVQDPRCLGRDLDFNGTVYRQLDPVYFAWLQYQFTSLDKVEGASNLDPDARLTMKARFHRIKRWASARFGGTRLTEAWQFFRPRCQAYRPPSLQQFRELGIIGVERPAPVAREHLSGHRYPLEGEWPFFKPVNPKSVAKVQTIEDQARALGWTKAQLYQNRDHLKFPYGSNYGLVCFVNQGERIGHVFESTIEIIKTGPSFRVLNFSKPSGSGLL